MSGAPYGTQIVGLAPIANVRLGWKRLASTKALAYGRFYSSSHCCKVFFSTFSLSLIENQLMDGLLRENSPPRMKMLFFFKPKT
jgi:hypothetical protein